MEITYTVQDALFGGKGLFSLGKVLKGTLVWKFKVGDNVIEYDARAAQNHLMSLNASDAKDFLDLSYGRGDKLCLVIDDGRYMNHSTDPNCLTYMQTGYTYAIRDIEPNEQLFEDYGTFDHPSFLLPLLQKYDCAPNYYELPERFDE